MDTYYDIKDMLRRELDEITRKGELSAGSLETIDKILNSIKNVCKITMYEEYSDDGHSYADGDMMGGNSMASGNQRRDARGRYSRRDGSRGDGRGGRYSRNYSYHDGNDEKIDMLRDMMDEAHSDDERRTIQKIIRRMENN